MSESEPVETELAGEIQVPLIVSGDGHDRAGAVPGEHVVGQEPGSRTASAATPREATSPSPFLIVRTAARLA